MFKNLNTLFNRRQQNNIRRANTITTKADFQHTSGCQGLSTGQQPIVSLYIKYVWIVHWVVSLVSKFSVKHPNCLITFI